MIELPDDLQPLHTVPDPDWELIEHLASRAHRTGDVYRNRVVTGERALQIMELDVETVEVIVNHLWFLQPEAMALSLEALDVQAVLAQRQAKRQKPQQAAERAAASRELSREQAWQAAQADPEATLQAMQQAITAAATPREAAGQLARLLGVKPARALAEMQPEIERRQLLLLGVIEAAKPPADQRTELLEEAMNWASELPTAQRGLDWWHRRQPGGGQDWREVFRFGTQFALGETAVLAVADAVGVDPDEVRQHAAWLAARDDLQRRQVAAAYTTAEDLLTDAAAAGGWGELSWALRVAPWLLERRCCELTVQS